MRNCFVLVVTLALTACGGGGGSGSSSSGGSNNPPTPPPVNRGFTASVTSISRAASVAGDEPFDGTIQITITDSSLDQFGFRATYTRNGIAYATRTDHSLTSIDIFIGFTAPPNIAPGTYNDTVRLGFCADAGCTAFKENALDIPVSYTVTVGTLPTVSLATNTVSLSRLPWDIFTPDNVRVPVTVSPHTRYFLIVTTTQTSNGISSVTYSQDVNDLGNIVIGFKPSTQLSPGVYTDTINVSACIEQNCQYPLAVSPSVITVTYNVTNTMPGAQGYSVRRSAQPVADIAWSEARHTLYAAIPTQAANYQDSVVEIDPVTEAVSNAVAAGFNPSLLALSDDESALYVSQSRGDSIRRFTTAPLTPDVLISLGNHSWPPGTEPMFAADMQVAPAQPHVLAVRRNTMLNGNVSGAGIVLFDDAVQRPDAAQISVFSDWGNVAWNPGGTLIYTNQAVLSVTPTGLTFLSNLQGSQGRLQFINGLLYSDDAHIVDPAAPQSYVWYDTQGQSRAATIDIAKNRAYFATQYLGGETIAYIEVFNFATREFVGRALLPGVASGVRPTRLVRYGTDGVALVNSANELYLIQGSLIQ